MPAKWRSWSAMMTMAAPLEKPVSTGWLRRLAKTPSLMMPMTSRISPDSADRMTAPATGSIPAPAPAMAAATMIAAMDVGPMERSRLVPSKA